MGSNQARLLSEMDEYDLVGVCDQIEERAEEVADSTGAKAYADFATCLREERPDVAAVATQSASHAALTLMAAECGSMRGVYTEKPMATNMRDARAMVETCERNGVKLVINHQRRIRPDLVKARELIESGAVGTVRRIRAQCAGDVLSDGTHAIDSALHLADDPEAQWVFAALHREINEEMIARAERQRQAGKESRPGYRYGHLVENGAMAVVQLATDLRVELFTGDMREEGRIYQDYEVFGEEGRIWRTGDRVRPNLFIQDAEGGDLRIGRDEDWQLVGVPAEDGRGAWRAVPYEDWTRERGAIAEGYRRLAAWIHDERPHEMCARNALRGFEVLMAIYESARLRRRIELPLEQERFPLELMVDAS
jgi:predicted dehydrogenase